MWTKCNYKKYIYNLKQKKLGVKKFSENIRFIVKRGKTN